ncbi:MAG: diguanylate cyclase [Pseudomonadota bacterium]
MNRLLINRRYWIVPVLLWTVLVGGSYLWNIDSLDRHVEEQVLRQSRFVFQMMESARLWNARHGGVYGLMDAETPANPYLEVLERDLVTPLGKRLTLLNPAYMSRQLARILDERMGVHVHLTSLAPLNPGNKALVWEAEALLRLARGQREFIEIHETSTVPLVRYMAPLFVEQPCLECHRKQGYREGDMRGGIGVSFPLDQVMPGIARQQANIGIVHLATWLILCLLTLSFLDAQRRRVLALQRTMDEQERIVQDRTAALRKEVDERQAAEARMRLLLNSSGEGIIGLDAAGHCTFCNPMALELLGYRDKGGVVGRSFHALVQAQDGLGGADRQHWLRIEAWRAGEPVHQEDAVFRRGDGSDLAVEFRIHPMLADGVVQGAVVSFADISERKEAQERIWRQANYDPLTGLPNRQLLFDRLEQAIAQARRLKDRLSVLFIDLDRFKQVNDQYGHELGDRLLQEVATRMSSCMRSMDTLARLGGDEFIMLLQGHNDPQGAERVAEKIIACLSTPFLIDGHALQIGASVGIAYFPDHAQTAAELVRHADRAMYEVKEAGRNTYRVYQPQ